MAVEGHVKVQTDALTKEAGQVKTQIGQIKEGFHQLKQLIEGTVNFWVGDAGEYHRKQYQSKVEQIEGILFSYQEQVKDLEQMAGVYEMTEQTIEKVEELLPMSDL